MYDVIIIGAGMSGITAAIYAARKRMKYKLISKDIGGQFTVSGVIENYPGYSSIDSMQLLEKMKEQMKINDIEVTEEEVKSLEKEGDIFNVKTDKNEYESEVVIFATGASPRKLGVPGEKKFMHKGLTYCAVCDGPLFSEKQVAVIGGGNSALEAAEFLMNIAKKIYIINIMDDIKGDKYLQERICCNDKIEIINGAETTEVFGDKFIKGLKYKKDDEEKELAVEGIFIEIGRIPNSDIVKDLCDISSSGHVKISKFCETSTKGMYAAGDVTDMQEYQYVIAAGHGCTALLSAARCKHKRCD